MTEAIHASLEQQSFIKATTINISVFFAIVFNKNRQLYRV